MCGEPCPRSHRARTPDLESHPDPGERSHRDPQRDRPRRLEHRCIEGWSSIVHWGGARFSDFHARYADQVGDVPYVSLETPDGLYYVGWDIPSIMHPQTMLALRQAPNRSTRTTERHCAWRLPTSTASSVSSASA